MTWCFKHARIHVHMSFQSDQWWLELVAYIGKYMDFLLTLMNSQEAHFPKYTFKTNKGQGRIIVLKTFGPQK